MLYKPTEHLENEEFRNPGPEYRGTPFWAWNTTMTEDNIRFMIEVMRDMGMGGAHLHVRAGLTNKYLSPEFMQLIKSAHKDLSENHMLTWLYDEDRWPSGFAGGFVTSDHRYRSRSLVFSCKAPDEENTGEAHYSSSGSSVRSRERTLLARYEIELDDGYLASYRMLGDGENAENGKMLRYAYLEVSGDNPWFNDQAYVNVFDKNAIDEFIRQTHELYYETLGEYFGGDIPAIFTDEPQFPGKQRLGFANDEKDVSIPFSDDFEEDFTGRYGHSLLAALPELFWEKADGSFSVIRYEYHDYACERFVEAYADNIGKWCTDHGLLLAGHMMEEPTLTSQTAVLSEAMRSYRGFGLPGIDMLCDRREFTTAKQAQSASHQKGAPGVLSELYGVTGYCFDFRGHKLQGDWQAALGVTVRVPHLTWTAMAGEAKRDYPASIGYQSPWYKEYRLIEDYFARVNTALTRGQARVRVGVIHPIESFWLLWGNDAQTGDARKQREEEFSDIVDWLLLGLVDFDFISESLLARFEGGEAADNVSQGILSEKNNDYVNEEIQSGKYDDNANKGISGNNNDSANECLRYGNDDKTVGKGFKCGCMYYDAVIVPDLITIRSTTLDLLTEFAKADGKVIIAGKCPELVDARPSDAPKELASLSEIIPYDRYDILNSIETFRSVDIRYENGLRTENLIYQLRHEKCCDWLFIAHAFRNDPVDIPHKEKLNIELSGEYKPVLYDAMSGEIYEIPYEIKTGKTCIQMSVYDQDSLLFKLDPVEAGSGQNSAANGNEIANSADKTSIRINVPAEVEYNLAEPNVLLLDMAECSLDGGEYEPLEEILRLDNGLRKRLGYPLRMHAQAQPWVIAGSGQSDRHTVRLKYTFESQIEGTEADLALEDASDCEITFNGESVESIPTGTYVDMDIDRIRLGKLKCGINTLIISMPYYAARNLEAVYVLGDFGVRLKGSRAIITGKPATLCFSDISAQDMAFYSGNVDYLFDIDVPGEGRLVLSATCFRCPAIAVEIDGRRAGLIAFSPYEVCIDNAAKGRHTIKLTAFGNRMNTFGPLHLCDYHRTSQSPDSWRTSGPRWSYEYRTAPTGILKRPEILYFGK